MDDEGYTIHFSNEKLEEKYRLMGPAVFATQMMDDPSFNSVATFKAEWIRKWNPKPDGLNIYMIVDPASGKTGRKHDYTVILVFGIDAMENMMILDIVRDKIGLEDKFITLSTLYQRYRPIRLYYEQVSMQQDISSLEMLMDKYNTRFPITAFSRMTASFNRFPQPERSRCAGTNAGCPCGAPGSANGSNAVPLRFSFRSFPSGRSSQRSAPSLSSCRQPPSCRNSMRIFSGVSR